MKKVILILFILVMPIILAGCSSAQSRIMTNDEIIAETNKCHEAGLLVGEVWQYNGYGGMTGITKIVCITSN
ncbi:MAG: hypothetical protein EOL88_00610 [Bacteroidia bacterium]|nr:hypothetical protein [Bacteroidia bacterium]